MAVVAVAIVVLLPAFFVIVFAEVFAAMLTAAMMMAAMDDDNGDEEDGCGNLVVLLPHFLSSCLPSLFVIFVVLMPTSLCRRVIANLPAT